jgi:hypothetical protein
LHEADIRFSRTHDLVELLTQLEPVEPLWTITLQAMRQLTQYAVHARYPGFVADAEAARTSFNICCEVRSLARLSLGLQQ